MKRNRVNFAGWGLPLAGTLLVVVGFVGCQRVTPVTEIRTSSSASGFREVDDSHLQQEWASWRGPQGDGHVTDQPLLTTWGENRNVVWRVDVPGRGHASPIVVGDFVLLATADEQEQIQSVHCYRRQDGLLVWSQSLHQGGLPGTSEMHQKSTHANGTLACDGTRVYCAFMNSGRVLASALELETGKRVWDREVGPFVSVFGYAPSPLLYHSLVIVAGDNKGGGYLAAMDRETGEIVWRIARTAENTFASPAIVHLNGQDQLVMSGMDLVDSYNPTTGDQLWSSPGTAKATCGTVVAAQDRLFASGGFPGKQTVCMDGAGQLLWSNRDRLYEPSLIVVGDHLYGVSDDGIAMCWSSEDGSQRWRQRLSGKFSASPIVCNGILYVSNLSGETYVFRANPDFYEELAVNSLGNDCFTSAAVKESQLFLRIGIRKADKRQEQLVCLQELTEK